MFFPETKGLALEDVDRLFCEDFGAQVNLVTDKPIHEHFESVAEGKA